MTDYLLFRLYGPLASWGDVAVGELRPSHAAPTKSAVFGLIAAALGLRRDDADAQASLHESYGFAVRVDHAGELLLDYHSIETPYARAIDDEEPPTTRRDELRAAAALAQRASDGAGSKTNLSRREYRSDALAAAAIWIVAPKGARWTLEELAAALRSPTFVPYLGRKSCVVALPFAPTRAQAEHPVHALRDVAFAVDALLVGRPSSHRHEFRWEGAPADPLAQQTVRRRDQARSRTKWLFADREEHVRVELVSGEPKEGSRVSQPN